MSSFTRSTKEYTGRLTDRGGVRVLVEVSHGNWPLLEWHQLSAPVCRRHGNSVDVLMKEEHGINHSWKCTKWVLT